MNKISPLDIRVAILAYPLVAKDDAKFSARFPKPVVTYTGDERMIFLFQNSPKPHSEATRSRIPLILRKGQFAIIRVVEILKSLLERKEDSAVFEDILPPRQLWVPQLPYPPFQTAKPPRFFWHPAYICPKDEYTPCCLIPEFKEEMLTAVYNSVSICAYARYALPKKGILRQDHEGFVYLELSDNFITEIYSLIHDQKNEEAPLYYVESSPAHIPVILPHEWTQRKGWGEIKDLENQFAFEISTLRSLKPTCWPDVEKIYFFEIKSHELENLRERHLLPPRIRGHDFHVAVAFEKAVRKPAHAIKETFRLNVSCFAA
jgi:hypothetical protein